MKDTYIKQVTLLLEVLPDIAEETNFAMHGGTAINLFHLNMPRVSVDIDLTYIPFSSNRDADLENIRISLEAIKKRLKKRIPAIRFSDPQRAYRELKLICSISDATVKIEVNQINRGLISKPCTKILCQSAQKIFDRFCEITTVSAGQLWGGKVSAALDRQHPRDLFDMRNLLNDAGFTDEIKTGFIFFLICGNRPIHELLNPKRLDQRLVFDSQFSGMTDQTFSYEDFEKTREEVILKVHNSLTVKDKAFLLTFIKGEPNWDDVDYSTFPAVKWKLYNIQKFKIENPQKYKHQIELLEELFICRK